MADEGLSLRDIKRQERLEKRGGGLGRLPASFWLEAAKLRSTLQQALRDCGPADSTRYIDLHEDLKRLESLLREITVNRERKLLLAAHEAVSGLRPDLAHLEEREKPLFEDLKRVLTVYRQQVFTGPELPEPRTPTVEEEEGPEATPLAGPEGEAKGSALPSVMEPVVEPAMVEDPGAGLDPTLEIPPPEPTKEPLLTPPEPDTRTESEPTVPKPADGPEPSSSSPPSSSPLPSSSPSPRDLWGEEDVGSDPASEYQLVRVLEEHPPFTGLDARIYTLKVQDVISMPALNARRLIEVGVLAPIKALPGPAAADEAETADNGENRGG